MKKTSVIAFSKPEDEYVLSGAFFRKYIVLDYSKIPDEFKLEALRIQVLGLNPSSVSRAGYYRKGIFQYYNTWSTLFRRIPWTIFWSLFVGFSLSILFYGVLSFKTLYIFFGALVGSFLGQIISTLFSRKMPIDIRSSVVREIPDAFCYSSDPVLSESFKFAHEIRRELYNSFIADSEKFDLNNPIWKNANDFLSKIVELHYLLPKKEQKEFVKSKKYRDEMIENLENGKTILNSLNLKPKDPDVRGALESSRNVNILEPDDLIPDYSTNDYYLQPDFKKD